MPRVSWKAATEELARRDPRLATVIDRTGPVKLRARNPDGPFGALVRAIVFQQLAGKAAAAIHGRVRALVDGPLTPDAVLALPETDLRGAGLSASKTASILDLATKVATGTVPLDDVRRLTDEAIVDRLVTVRGIGRWTAEMFLLFELRRLDVWPVDDLGVRHGYGLMHGVERPTAKELVELGDPYRPYRSVAAWYCWRAVDLERQGENTWS
jgi:DNA-3-methyladenine glycosylase II